MAKPILAAAILAVIAAVVIEVRAYKQGRRRITRGQVRIRIITASLLLLVLLMAFISEYVLPSRGEGFQKLSRHEKSLVISYWLFCLAVSFSLIVLAMADLRICLINYALHRKEMRGVSESGMEHRN